MDINPEKVLHIRKERAPVFSFCGDAATALNDLTDYAVKNDIGIEIDGWIEHVTLTRKAWPMNYRRDSEALQQAEVLDLLSRLLPDNAIVTTGVGNHQLLAAQYLRMKHPRSFLTSGSMAAMGSGCPMR